MLSGNRHWLEYDSVALVALFVGIGFVALIVLGILKSVHMTKAPRHSGACGATG